MSNVAHKDLTDPNLHESKGVATATAGQVYVADGAGSGVMKLLLKKYTAALTPAAVSANTTAEQTFTVTGVVVATDVVVGVSKPTAQAGLGIVGWRVTADNTVGITFSNNTAGSITPTAGETYSILVNRA
jgi:hypothetical protein